MTDETKIWSEALDEPCVMMDNLRRVQQGAQSAIDSFVFGVDLAKPDSRDVTVVTMMKVLADGSRQVVNPAEIPAHLLIAAGIG